MRRLSPVGLVWSGSRLHLPDKFVRTREEAIFDQDAADDQHRMRAKNIDGVGRRQQIYVKGADDRVVVIRQHAIKTHLVFDPFIPALPVVHGRFGVRDHPRQGEAESGAGLQCLLDQDKHGVFVEASGLEIGVLRQQDFELAAFHRFLNVDTNVAQPLEVILLMRIREDMKGAVAAIDAIADERQQRVVLLCR